MMRNQFGSICENVCIVSLKIRTEFVRYDESVQWPEALRPYPKLVQQKIRASLQSDSIPLSHSSMEAANM